MEAHLYKVLIACEHTQEAKDKWGNRDYESEHNTFVPDRYTIDPDPPWEGRHYRYIYKSVRQVPDEEWLVAANYARSFHPDICCELAILDNCVCSWKSLCPIHGAKCHGSHD
jgi:hypothetical protein